MRNTPNNDQLLLQNHAGGVTFFEARNIFYHERKTTCPSIAGCEFSNTHASGCAKGYCENGGIRRETDRTSTAIHGGEKVK